MSDDFVRCPNPNCGAWDSMSLMTKSDPNSNDDGCDDDVFKCDKCGITCRRDELSFTHVEYMNGRVVD